MSYNGYANEDSYYFDVVWANDSALYEAIKCQAKSWSDYRILTNQTVGRNVMDALRAAISGGGWGYSGVPECFKSVPRSSYEYLTGSKGIDLGRVNEEEFGANIRTALEVDNG